MSSTSRTVLWVVIVALIALALYWAFSSASTPAIPDTNQGPAATATGTNAGTLSTQNSDDSDAALAQDSAAVGTQMSGLDSDNSAMNSSLSDQEVVQSY